MSQVLDIDSLLESPLADLHALASELNIEGYRMLRKPDLAVAILVARGADEDAVRPKVQAKAKQIADAARERELAAEREAIAEDEERDTERRERMREHSRDARHGRDRQRGGRGGDRQARSRGGDRERGDRERGGDRQRGGDRDRDRQRGDRTERPRRERQPRARADERQQQGQQTRKPVSEAPVREERATEAPKEKAAETVRATGVFEPGAGGGGRLRTDLTKRVREDVEVMRGEVRKWRLHRGDVVVGEAKRVRRGRTNFQLTDVAAVNGQSATERGKQAVRFAEAPASPPAGRWGGRMFKRAPFGAGSRVVVTGHARPAASDLLVRLAGELAGSGINTTLIVVTPRPDQTVASSGSYDVIVGDGTQHTDPLPGLELALERGKRLAEAGREAALLIDGIDLLPEQQANDLFTSARNLSDRGALTIVGSAGAGSVFEAQASTIAVIADSRRLKLDKKKSWTQG